MQSIIVIILLSIITVQTIDYDINNQQICTHKPFMANFNHNCTRSRLTKDVTIPNTDQVLYIAVILVSSASSNITLKITKSLNYNQTVHLTFFTLFRRVVYLNNKTMLPLNLTTINYYSYEPMSEQVTRTNSEIFIPLDRVFSEDPFCYLKNTTLPQPDASRIYYLYTNETNLNIDLSKSSYYISPRFYGFDICWTTETGYTTTSIVLFSLIGVFSLITLILIGFCLKDQIIYLIRVIRNYINQKLGLPTVTVDAPSPQ